MIQTVKKQKDGYLVNGTMYVPSDEANKEHQMVLDWVKNGGVVENEYTPQELEKQKQQVINQTAKEYLLSTDWYIIRKQETGVEVPQDVLTKRENARSSIKE